MNSFFAKQIYLTLFFLTLLNVVTSSAQKQEWEIDKFLRSDKLKQKQLDSILVHLGDRWEVKLTFGKYFFLNNSRSNEETLTTFSNPMTAWQLSGTWHFSEQLMGDITIGIQLKKDIPDTPNIGAVLSGDDIEIEGSGVGFFPIELGLRYYFVQNRFRPFLGLGTGRVNASYKYTFAEGNINNGIVQTENQITGRALFGSVKSGFDYRLNENLQLYFNCSYNFSNQFKEPVGGYIKYNGISGNIGLSIIL